MTCKADRHKPSNRPKKSDAQKRKRLKVQKKRLVALGLAADKVEKLDPNTVREMLRRPAKIAKK